MEKIYEFIDIALDSLKQENLMFLPHSKMPEEMIDMEVNKDNDWIPWKPVLSKVTDTSLLELEEQIGLIYPNPYKEFLKYKHFYDLEVASEIRFFRHCIRDWKDDLLEQYFDSWEPDVIIKAGFIPFADYSDWGIVCFDTNRMRGSDCPIVMFDHECLYDEPVQYEELYESFETMIAELTKELRG
jgi:hypothetical protein